MIGRLTGLLIEKKPPRLMIDVGGVGYELDAPMSTFYDLPDLNNKITLHVHMVVREDAQLLYGFSKLADRRLFRALIKVSGIGPKVSLAILSGIPPEAFVQCIMHSDIASLVRIPGIGKKTAERLVVEMRDRLQDWQFDTLPGDTPSEEFSIGSAISEAISALVALGYKQQEANNVVSRIKADNLSSEQLIKQALQALH